MSYLTEAAEHARRSLERRPISEGSLLLRIRAMPPVRDVDAALREARSVPIVAEARRTSPFPGAIGPAGRDPGELAERYEAGGAAAVSVVTEPLFFDGSLPDVRTVRRRTSLPVIRRDVFVHPGQVIEARAEGADAVLLVASVVSAGELKALLGTAEDVSIPALVECHSLEDVDRAAAAGATTIVASGRQPESLVVEREAMLALVRAASPGGLVIAEGDLRIREEVSAAVDAGAEGVLVGTALMRSRRPEDVLRALRAP